MHHTAHQDASIAKPQSSPPRQRDTLSDTGVMRILGEYPPPHDKAAHEELPAMRQCPLCSRNVPEASTVCKHCQCYVGPSPDYLTSLNGSTHKQPPQP